MSKNMWNLKEKKISKHTNHYGKTIRSDKTQCIEALLPLSDERHSQGVGLSSFNTKAEIMMPSGK